MHQGHFNNNSNNNNIYYSNSGNYSYFYPIYYDD